MSNSRPYLFIILTDSLAHIGDLYIPSSVIAQELELHQGLSASRQAGYSLKHSAHAQSRYRACADMLYHGQWHSPLFIT